MFELIASTAFGVEKLVKEEILGLGFNVTAVENGAVYFNSDEEGICRANIWLGIPNRIFIKMGIFEAKTFDELFDNTIKIDWAKIIPKNGAFPVVKVSSVKSALFAKSTVQSIVKKAVVKSLYNSYSTDQLAEEGPTYPIHVKILKDSVTLSIDTSGESLSKRGYRGHGNKAPLRETLAAAIVAIAKVDFENEILYDPLCGTGTILIEAAMLANNIAPGLNRKFISEDWELIDSEIWNNVRTEAKEYIQNKKLNIYGSDISGGVIYTAQENAKLAGVDKTVSFFQSSVADAGLDQNKVAIQRGESEENSGVIICNPPYGERLLEKNEAEALYKQMGEVFMERFKNWDYYILTANLDFERHFGRRADKKRKLYNGKLECCLFQYFSKK